MTGGKNLETDTLLSHEKIVKQTTFLTAFEGQKYSHFTTHNISSLIDLTF